MASPPAAKAMGLSQERLAEAVGVETSTVARWERGETDPLAVYRPRLAEALKITLEELGALLEGEASETPADERRRFVVQHPGQVDLVAVAHLRQRVYDLDARYVITPPTALLSDAAECLSQAAHLRTAATTGRVQRELQAIEAEAGFEEIHRLGKIMMNVLHLVYP